VLEKTIRVILKINKKIENIEKIIKNNKFDDFEILHN